MNLGVDFLRSFVAAGGDLDIVDFENRSFLDYYVHKLAGRPDLLYFCLENVTSISKYSYMICGEIWDSVLTRKKKSVFENLFL
jgi:hypothetical protein